MQNWHPYSKNNRSFYLIVISLFIFGILWITLNLFVGHDFIICPTKRFLHLPCPGCGMSRALISFLKGDFIEAMYYNINIVFVLPFIIIVSLTLLYDCIFLDTITLRLYNKINTYIDNKYFIISFIAFELVVEYHNIVNNI